MTTCDLQVDKITKRYQGAQGPIEILGETSFAAKTGETIAIIGPSGAGKSTLLNILGSLDKPDSGSAKLGDIEITSLEGRKLAEFRSQKVGFVFQEHHLLPQLTAIENVMLPGLASSSVSGDVARELLDYMGVSHRAAAFPWQMSGGERQRVAIARAMIHSAPLLLCDEPTGNLDRETGQKIGELFIRLAKAKNVLILVVTHNLDLAEIFQRRFQLQDGLLKEK